MKVKVQKVKRQIMLREWSEQIKAREQSGLSVSRWCAENGVNQKTYYYRLRRVREELIEALEAGSAHQLPGVVEIAKKQPPTQAPVFATLPMPQSPGASVTVWIGGCAVDIQNSVDGAVLEQVLRVVSRL